MTMAAEKHNLKVEVRNHASQVEKEALDKGITDYNSDTAQEKRLNCYILAYDGRELIGGLYGCSIKTDYYIKLLWVEKNFRAAGIGKNLIGRAELEAAKRQCTRIHVDTLSYQAPEFYKKLGYSEMVTVPQYRGTYDRIFLRKDV